MVLNVADAPTALMASPQELEPLPASVDTAPVSVMKRIAQFELSATYTFPLASTATLAG